MKFSWNSKLGQDEWMDKTMTTSLAMRCNVIVILEIYQVRELDRENDSKILKLKSNQKVEAQVSAPSDTYLIDASICICYE